MAGIGPITPKQFGKVDQPQILRLVLPSANARAVTNHGLFSSIGYPGGRGQMMSNGMDPLRHTLDEVMYRTGLLAPRTALVATPTGAQAAATINLDVSHGGASIYNPADGEEIVIYSPITFKTSVGFNNPSSVEVKIGATGIVTLNNLQDYLENKVGTQGLTWDSPAWYIGVTKELFTITRPETWQLTATVDAFSAAGNGYAAYLLSGTWTDSSLGSTGGTVGTAGNFEGGSDGSGTDPAAGTYRYRAALHRSEDGAISGVGPEVVASQGNDQNIDLSSIPAVLEDDDIDYKRWYRTLSSGSKLYHGRDIVVADSTDTDDIDNDVLETHVTQSGIPTRTYEGGMIERVKYLAHYKDRWIGGGVERGAEYDHGTATVTNGSNAIVITGGHVTKEMEHWTFNTVQSTEDDALEMEIVYVDEDNLTIYVHADWEGVSSTSAPVAYTIRDTRDPFLLYYCEPRLPNQTNTTMSLEGARSPDPVGLTGLIAVFESVVIFTRTGLWRLTGSEPLNFRVTHEYEGVGCIGGHSVVDTGDGVIYWVGADGIYGWSGKGEPFEVSNPPMGQGDKPRGIARTIKRINQQVASGIFAHYDSEDRVVRWFVPLDGAIVNTHAIVFDLQTASWSLDEIPPFTYALTVTDGIGNLQTIAGDVHGCLWQLDISTSDGAFEFEPVQTIAAGAGLRTFTIDNAVLPTASSGLKGVPGYIVRVTAGTFTPFLIYSNTSTVVTLATALATAPSDGDYAVFGGIHMQMESGRFAYEQKSIRKTFEALKVMFAAQTEGEYWASYAVDQGTAAVIESGDLSSTDGENHHWVRNEGRRHQIRLDAVGPGFEVQLEALRTWIRASDMDG